ncbi:MAG TPA: NAD(P)H-hydrate dehydratase [Methanomassiliicoccales archaeon]|nr:NAD(P)H-hydrate dehydratase [Methanomassiliicoccales archaeon]
MLPYKEFTVLDVNAEHLGVPTSLLMDNAGRAVADVIQRKYGKGRRIVVLCGSGNNSGDGFVAARYLREENEVAIILARPQEDIRTVIARDAFEAVKDLVVQAEAVHLHDFDLIVDALLGTGAHGHLEDPYAGLIERANNCIRPVVSIDVPSGLGTDHVIEPEVTVTFHDIKEGMNEENSGKIVVRDIGIPEDAQKYVGPGEFAYYPIPDKDSHKGMNGQVLIVGGGPYTGAPALAAMGAFGMKVDLVNIATPERAWQTIASFSPNFIVRSLPGDVLTEAHVPQLKRFADRADAVLIGPGLGDDPATMNAVRSFVSWCKKPMVIDADAQAAVGAKPSVLKGKSVVVTPHAREFEDLGGAKLPADYEARVKPVQALAKKLNVTILLKGRIDVIGNGKRWKLNRTGNAGMSVGGTGDVLAGEVVGLLSRGVAPFDASRLAAFTNGYAGDMAFEELGFGLLATDVAERVPMVVRPFIDRFL